MYNGRVDVMGVPPPRNNFRMIDEKNNGNRIFNKEALRGIQTNSPLARVYFSQKNIDGLQQMLRYHVWLVSEKRHTIGRQSDRELQIIMRSIYLQNSRNLPDNIVGQVKLLNKLVIDYCIPRIISSVEQYLMYKKDVSTMPTPMPRSVNVSLAGTKSYSLAPRV